MPYKPRIEYENAIYHLISRGNEKKEIFYDEWDYKKFISKLKKICLKYKAILISYCLMSNHTHLLLKTLEPNLSVVMRDLLSGYSIYFNKRHSRVGHLFQGRYKSFIVEDDAYLIELSKYIHMNPCRAKLTQRPEDYNWSSMRIYLNMEEESFIEKNIILNYFKDLQDYYKFVLTITTPSIDPFFE